MKFQRLFLIKISLVLSTFLWGQAQGKTYDIFVLRGLIRGGVYSVGSTEKMKDTIIQNLGISAENVKIHNLEIKGNGNKFNQTSATRIEDMIEDVRADFQKMRNPNSEAVLVAISLGGMIGINWANKYPKDFAKAFILNSSLPTYCGLFDRVLPSSWYRLASGALSSDPFEKESLIFDVIISGWCHLTSPF